MKTTLTLLSLLSLSAFAEGKPTPAPKVAAAPAAEQAKAPAPAAEQAKAPAPAAGEATTPTTAAPATTATAKGGAVKKEKPAAPTH